MFFFFFFLNTNVVCDLGNLATWHSFIEVEVLSSEMLQIYIGMSKKSCTYIFITVL